MRSDMTFGKDTGPVDDVASLFGEINQFAMVAIDGRIAAFAVRMLADNGMSPRCLARLLPRLEESGKEAAVQADGKASMCISPAVRQPRNARCAARTGL